MGYRTKQCRLCNILSGFVDKNALLSVGNAPATAVLCFSKTFWQECTLAVSRTGRQAREQERLAYLHSYQSLSFKYLPV